MDRHCLAPDVCLCVCEQALEFMLMSDSEDTHIAACKSLFILAAHDVTVRNILAQVTATLIFLLRPSTCLSIFRHNRPSACLLHILVPDDVIFLQIVAPST